MKYFTKYLTVALVFGLISPAFAELQGSVKSQAMSFAKKKAVAEITETASAKVEEPTAFGEPLTLAETTPVSVNAPVSTPTYNAVPSKTPLMAPPTPVKTSVAVAPTVVSSTTKVAAPAATPSAAGSEAQIKLQAIKTQEQWVAKLTKQLEGEKNQLKEMREGYAQAFGKEDKAD